MKRFLLGFATGVCSLVLLVALVVVVLISLDPTGGRNRAFEKVEYGMTQEQVVALMGPPDSTAAEFPIDWSYGTPSNRMQCAVMERIHAALYLRWGGEPKFVVALDADKRVVYKARFDS